jgi:ECF transporter S component (folate family)
MKKAKFQIRFTIKTLYFAVFTLFYVILRAFCEFSIYNINVSFVYIPAFLTGIFLGPVYGLFAGLTGDLLAMLLTRQTISVLLLLGGGLYGAVMGTVFKYGYIKNEYIKISAGAFSVLVIVVYVINTIAYMLPPFSSYTTYYNALMARLPQFIVIVVNTAATLGLYYPLSKTTFKYLTKRKKKR